MLCKPEVKKALAVLRTAAGILLVLLIFPPLSVGMCNVFVFLPAAAGLTLILFPIFPCLLKKLCGAQYKRISFTLAALVAAACFFFSAEFCVLFFNSFRQEAPSDSVVVVLGAKVEGKTPTLDLMGRIDAAGQYLQNHPGTRCIATGGMQGTEEISEGECIRGELIRFYGISPDRIYTDSTSRNTVQNFRNALSVIRRNGLPRNVLVATDGFHMFRSKFIAKRLGLHPYSCPAATDPRIQVPHYLRELLALPKSILFDR